MMTMMKASCYHENAQRQVHEQELRMIDVMMVSAQKPCCTAGSQPPLPEPTKLHTSHRTLDPSECERYFRHAGYDPLWPGRAV